MVTDFISICQITVYVQDWKPPLIRVHVCKSCPINIHFNILNHLSASHPPTNSSRFSISYQIHFWEIFLSKIVFKFFVSLLKCFWCLDLIVKSKNLLIVIAICLLIVAALIWTNIVLMTYCSALLSIITSPSIDQSFLHLITMHLIVRQMDTLSKDSLLAPPSFTDFH